jgi:hypothetical protein
MRTGDAAVPRHLSLSRDEGVAFTLAKALGLAVGLLALVLAVRTAYAQALLDVCVQDVPGVVVTGANGATNTVQFTPDLGVSNQWTALTNLYTTAYRWTFADTGGAGAQRRFYRVVTVPGAHFDASRATSANDAIVLCQLPSGAIVEALPPVFISPYVANLAAMGLVAARQHPGAVEKWMRWYVAHLNATDAWNINNGGTIYDYNVDDQGHETPTYDADSTDAYAATFLSLARMYFESGDTNAQAYIRSIKTNLENIADVEFKTAQSDALTVAKPNYPVRYLMDNIEVWRGLTDFALLEASAWDDAGKQRLYSAQAARIASSIESEMWNQAEGWYCTAVHKDGTKETIHWAEWYPDSVAQLFPIIYGLIAPTSARAVALYAQFNTSWPAWTAGQRGGDVFPWAMVDYAAAAMGDTARRTAYNQWVATNYPSYQWPWHVGEGGFFSQANLLQ